MTKNKSDFSKANAEQMFSFLVENGIINIGDVENAMTEKRREALLDQHPFDIYQGSDGRYRTYIEDASNVYGRRMIVKTHEQDLLDYLVEFYDNQEKELSTKAHTLESIYDDWKSLKSLHTNAENYIRRIHSDWKKYYVGTDIIKRPLNTLTKLELDTWAHKLIQDNKMTKKAIL